MKNKVISAIQAILGIGGFIYLIGLVGSTDLGRITLGEFFSNAWFLVFVPVFLYVLQDLKAR